MKLWGSWTFCFLPKVEVSAVAATALERMIANRLPRKDGGIVLTHLLNEKANRTELTVIKLAEERYYLVCAAFFEQRLIDHLNRHGSDAVASGGMVVTCLSEAWAAPILQGRSRVMSCRRPPMWRLILPLSAGCRRRKSILPVILCRHYACLMQVNWDGAAWAAENICRL